MSIELNLKEIERRAKHSVFQDGLSEIILGTFLFFYGGALTVKSFPWYLVVIVAIFLGKPALERIKAKYIYPRTGYVKMPPEPKSTGKGIIITTISSIVVLIGLMILLMIVMDKGQGILFFLAYIVPPASGILMAIGPVWMGQRYGIMRGYIYAGLFVLSGIAMPLFEIETGYKAVGLICTFVGFVILLVGGITFINFIRRNEPRTIEHQEITNV